MSSRRINLDTRVFPDPQRIAWMKANGIDPNTVPVAQEVLIEDGNLTFIQFVMGPGGSRQFEDGSYESGYQKTLQTIPLVSAPENFGL